MTFGGALVSAWIVARFAPEAEGHGTDNAIEAVHTDPRSIRARAVVVKMVSSALTIGSGGSAGREGPTAQISAGFGSLLTRRLDLSDEDGSIAVSLGIGSGIGAIFGAPLGGAVLAASIVYREDFDYRSLIPGFITSATAYTVYGLFLGLDRLFDSVTPEYAFNPAQLGWFVLELFERRQVGDHLQDGDAALSAGADEQRPLDPDRGPGTGRDADRPAARRGRARTARPVPQRNDPQNASVRLGEKAKETIAHAANAKAATAARRLSERRRATRTGRPTAASTASSA